MRNARNIFILSLFALSSKQLVGQKQSPPGNIKKQVVALIPSNKHTVISGLAIGFTARPWTDGADSLYVEINGLNIELGPLGIIGGIWGTMYGLVGERDSSNRRANFFSNLNSPDIMPFNPTGYEARVNGISISLGGITETINSGLFINGLSGTSYKTNGIQISGLLNLQHEFNGLLIAGLANNTRKGKGLQIALINNCGSGQVFQIGLFNRIGKRALPFINFNFKKEG